MENNEILDSGLSAGNELSLNAAARDYLRQTAKWTKFLAIIGFVFSALFIILGAAYGSASSYFSTTSTMQSASSIVNSGKTMSTMVAVVYIIFGLVMFYPAIRLFQFSSQSKTALETNDTDAIEIGFKRLRSFFRFYGIIIIIYLVLIVFVVATSGIGALTR